MHLIVAASRVYSRFALLLATSLLISSPLENLLCTSKGSRLIANENDLSIPTISPLSPFIKVYLEEQDLYPAPPIHEIPLEIVRRAFNYEQQLLNEKTPHYPVIIKNEFLSTDVGNLPIRIYQPEVGLTFPVILFFHGGGFTLGNLDTLDGLCQEISYFANGVVISVDYPLAPENPFPAAPEACYAAACAIYDRLDDFRGDFKHFFVGGSSSGGNLAAVVALMARDRQGPSFSGQLLLCPTTDTDFDSPSYLENSKGYNLTRELCLWFFQQYVKDPSQNNHPYIAPLRADSFQGLPQTFLVTAQYDPLRDESL